MGHRWKDPKKKKQIKRLWEKVKNKKMNIFVGVALIAGIALSEVFGKLISSGLAAASNSLSKADDRLNKSLGQKLAVALPNVVPLF